MTRVVFCCLRRAGEDRARGAAAAGEEDGSAQEGPGREEHAARDEVHLAAGEQNPLKM